MKKLHLFSLAVFGMAAFSAMMTASPDAIDNLTGRAIVKGCIKPCVTNNITFPECLHFAAWDPCNTNACIENVMFWAECDVNAPGSSKPDDCDMVFNPLAIYATQKARSSPNLKCGALNGPFVPSTVVPAATACRHVLPAMVRCEVPACAGALLNVGADRKGRDVCN